MVLKKSFVLLLVLMMFSFSSLSFVGAQDDSSGSGSCMDGDSCLVSEGEEVDYGITDYVFGGISIGFVDEDSVVLVLQYEEIPSLGEGETYNFFGNYHYVTILDINYQSGEDGLSSVKFKIDLDYGSDSDDSDEDDETHLCHFPPGNPGNKHTIEVGVGAVNAHLAHGDFIGECGDDSGGADVPAILGVSEIEENIKIRDRDGVERELRIRKRIRDDGSVEHRLRYKERDVLSEVEIEEEVDGSDLRRRRLRAKLSNGVFADIKVMPEVATERALDRLRLRVCSEENGCEIVLKEVGVDSGQSEVAYELRAEKRAKILGLFDSRMKVRAQVNAENGELVSVSKSWWAFLATEIEE